MTPEKLCEFKEYLRKLETLGPIEGGQMEIATWRDEPHETWIIGDGIGFFRLGLSILRYGVDAHSAEGEFKPKDQRVLTEFFAEPSKTRTLVLMEPTRPRVQRKIRRPSLLRLLGELFLGIPADEVEEEKKSKP